MNLRNMYAVEPVPALDMKTEIGNDPIIIDSVEDFTTLCPVSKVTGHRMNPLDALNLVLSPDKARLVQSVLQEIPSSGIPSDTGTFEFIADRLSLGTAAEREIYVNKLSRVADTLYQIRPDINPENKIKFEENDVKISSDEV